MFSNMSSDKGTDLSRPESYPHDLTNHITSQMFHFQQPSHWALGLKLQSLERLQEHSVHNIAHSYKYYSRLSIQVLLVFVLICLSSYLIVIAICIF